MRITYAGGRRERFPLHFAFNDADLDDDGRVKPDTPKLYYYRVTAMVDAKVVPKDRAISLAQ